MTVSNDITTVELLAGKKTTGEDVREAVTVKRVTKDWFEVTHSPGLVLGIAAGDVIKLHTADTGSFDVVQRGQNLCIQIFKGEPFSKSQRDQFARRMQEIQGRLDAESANELVFTVPVRLGFAAVESLLNSLVSDCQDCRWYFGNVYDPTDGVTPLSWWEL